MLWRHKLTIILLIGIAFITGAFFFNNKSQSVKFQAGFTIVKITSNGCVASSWARKNFSKDHFDKMVEYHLNGEVNPSHINTPLMVAVVKNEIENVANLLKNGAQINETNELGCTALIWALGFKRGEIFDLLIKEGANISQADASGRTPLIIAAGSGQLEIARKLIDLGADVNTAQDGGVNEIGRTALMDASTYKDNTDMLKLLIQHGAKVNAADEHGKTPLTDAAWYGILGNVKTLVDSGADRSAKTNSGKTALDIAVDMDRNDVVTYLSAL